MAAGLITEICQGAAKGQHRIKLALTGGRTVQPVYRYLADYFPAGNSKVNWDDIDFFWGDERWVEANHPDSNFKMARQLLLNPLEINPARIFPMVKSLSSPEAEAAAYEQVLRNFFPADLLDGGFPVFDLILLGMGSDGHIASLFPGTEALAEDKKWVTNTFPPEMEPAVDRITLTLPVINRARNVILLISGEDKKKLAGRVFTGKSERLQDYPVAMVRPKGRLIRLMC